ncbi:oxidoreductase [Dictyobacter sp. S3.2.2.5]|uniref:Oxidoreductase n=1 Tax=Dictyobacter halimunensis TaxID=3026934 RepID=A0ABQ6G6P3_9CHLR|nr:oxidoreductase [Dictyobacter sp. S3.2.2.5]
MTLATQTMWAARVSNYGGSEQLKFERIERPQPLEGEVLLRVHAVGVNPIDWKIRQGLLKEFMPVTFPYTPGIEVAGVVEEIGRDVRDFQIGDAVFGQCQAGAYAEYAVVEASVLAHKPQVLSFVEAAAVPVGATTAWRALFEYGKLTSDQWVLIVGAAGGVGSWAVQLAKWKGAQVIGTASTANLNVVRSLGADMVVDYTTTVLHSVVQQVDRVLNAVGGETLLHSLKTLRRGGTLISLAGPPPQQEAQACGVRAMMIHSQPSSDILQMLVRLIDAGHLKAIVGKTFSFSEVRLAHEYSRSGHGCGRIVLEMSA